MIETVLFQSDILNLNAALEAACTTAVPVTHSADAAIDLRSLASAVSEVREAVSSPLEADSLIRVRR